VSVFQHRLAGDGQLLRLTSSCGDISSQSTSPSCDVTTDTCDNFGRCSVVSAARRKLALENARLCGSKKRKHLGGSELVCTDCSLALPPESTV